MNASQYFVGVANTLGRLSPSKTNLLKLAPADTNTLNAVELDRHAAPPLISIHTEVPCRAVLSIESGVAALQILHNV